MLNDLDERTIHLSKEEYAKCIAFGKLMTERSRGFRNYRVSPKSDLELNIMGTLGECGTCHYGLLPYIPKLNGFRRADLPHNIEVRSSMDYTYHLKVRPDDDDSRRMVLAIVPEIGPLIRVVGWILAVDAKRIARLRDPHGKGQPMHMVHQDDLLPMRELREIVRLERKSLYPGLPSLPEDPQSTPPSTP